MHSEEFRMPDHARRADEVTTLMNQITETKRQCEVTKKLMRQKIDEMQKFCCDAREFLQKAMLPVNNEHT